MILNRANVGNFLRIEGLNESNFEDKKLNNLLDKLE